ncbi:polysaccharide lyase family 7 protein [Tamlana sp. 2_MG-2023]|uniref:polysaccharide lyase family 7 protein n=1 Tax=unclassified Tamlana TaxID=2614803 RepID=UPI0026E2B10C|nr:MULTISPECIES: polysaccharide lyase family 7 protein [unclassified Tamlana]MDO6759534.1 polysaccharide lyase family 7 protein [Tamlana sp. 2_MG-2023]MDO6790327.1 polysaccharide lyase family 7 protein [Tamlana sp. 1_MG-2023]
MKQKLPKNHMHALVLCMIFALVSSSAFAQTLIPADLMRNCSQWKITKPDGSEQKPLCEYPNQSYYYVNGDEDGIVFKVVIDDSNGSTANSNYIRSELRERLPDGSLDIYWTTAGTHVIYVEQAITHLPTYKNHLVATQIHGDKAADIDDAMVLRLEGQHLFLSFNGGDLRKDVTIKTDYALGTKHEVIFEVIDGKHYCYYSEAGGLIELYDSGRTNAASYLVKTNVDDGGNTITPARDYVMERTYDQSYFKVGNYTQSNLGREVQEATDDGKVYDYDAPNYGEVVVYDFSVRHGTVEDGGDIGGTDPPPSGSVTPRADEITIIDATAVGTEIGTANNPKDYVSPHYAYDGVVDTGYYWTGDASVEPEVAITLDLGCNRDLTDIGLYFLKAESRTTNFDVAVSQDGMSFNTVISNQDSASSGYTVDDEQLFDLSGNNARYVKIKGNGNSQANSGWTSFAEIRLYGDNADCSTLSTEHEITNQEVFSLHPNPASTIVKWNNFKDFETVTIYNLMGKIILKQVVQGNSIDVSSLNSGLYIFKFSGENGTINKRVIIK